jgi:hypothetical protein
MMPLTQSLAPTAVLRGWFMFARTDFRRIDVRSRID